MLSLALLATYDTPCELHLFYFRLFYLLIVSTPDFSPSKDTSYLVMNSLRSEWFMSVGTPTGMV